MADKYCPLDGSELNVNSGLYDGAWYSCWTCGIQYEARNDVGRRKEALDFISKLEVQIGKQRKLLEQDEGRLESLMLKATEQGLLK